VVFPEVWFDKDAHLIDGFGDRHVGQFENREGRESISWNPGKTMKPMRCMEISKMSPHPANECGRSALPVA
jgi:hypothetical protein